MAEIEGIFFLLGLAYGATVCSLSCLPWLGPPACWDAAMVAVL